MTAGRPRMEEMAIEIRLRARPSGPDIGELSRDRLVGHIRWHVIRVRETPGWVRNLTSLQADQDKVKGVMWGAATFRRRSRAFA